MDYKSMKYQELQIEAKSRGINTYQKKRDEIVKMLEDDDRVEVVEQQAKLVDYKDPDKNRFDAFMVEQAKFNKQVMEIVQGLVVKDGGKSAIKDVKINEEPPIKTNTKPFVEQKINEELDDEDDFAETEKGEEVVPVEPRVLRSKGDRKVSEIKLVGSAPEGMLLETYLREKGISFNELQNAVDSFSSTQPQRTVTLEDLKGAIFAGDMEAKSIVDSNKKSVRITNQYVADSLQNKYGWKSGKQGGIYYMERP